MSLAQCFVSSATRSITEKAWNQPRWRPWTGTGDLPWVPRRRVVAGWDRLEVGGSSK